MVRRPQPAHQKRRKTGAKPLSYVKWRLLPQVLGAPGYFWRGDWTMSLIVKIGKKGKRLGKKAAARGEAPAELTPAGIERVFKTPRRVCAMTFDDGPHGPARRPGTRLRGRGRSPMCSGRPGPNWGPKEPSTSSATTSGNYPDQAASWAARLGRRQIDHYPEIGQGQKKEGRPLRTLVRAVFWTGPPDSPNHATPYHSQKSPFLRQAGVPGPA